MRQIVGEVFGHHGLGIVRDDVFGTNNFLRYELGFLCRIRVVYQGVGIVLDDDACLGAQHLCRLLDDVGKTAVRSFTDFGQKCAHRPFQNGLFGNDVVLRAGPGLADADDS